MLRMSTTPQRKQKIQKKFSLSNFKNTLYNTIKTPKKKPSQQNVNPEELIKTYLRIRPIENSEETYCKILNEKEIEILAPEDSNAFKNGKQGPEQYIFHKVFPQEATQEQIYENIALPLIKKFLVDKINCLIFATGVTSSGKTYTVEGKEEVPGLLRNILATIINSLKESKVKKLNLIPLRYDEFKEDTTAMKEDSLILISKDDKPSPYIKVNDIIKLDTNLSYSLWASYYEIYNEQIYDLISSGEKRSLSIKIDQNKNNYVKDLKYVPINSYEDCDNILKQGKANRRKFSTRLNQSSSRSHSIFTLRLLCQNEEENDVFVTRFTIVDLAGSERANHTQSKQKQLKEAGSINKSIMVLTRVFDCLRNMQKGIQHELPPFNESKLTSLLKPSLINGHVSTIININPLPEFYDETLTVLRFSATVKEVAPISARVDSGLQTIKRPRIIIPKSQIKKKNIIYNKNDKSLIQNSTNNQNQSNNQNQLNNQNQNQNQPQTPNTSQIIISTPLSNGMKKLIGRSSKILGDGCIKIESNKKNTDNSNDEDSDVIIESVLTESEVCQLVDSFEDHINKLKTLLVESEIYRQEREFVIRNEMMKQIETQIGQLQEYQSIDTIKENNKKLVENLVNTQDLSQLQRDNDKLISKLKNKEMIINTLGQEIQTLEAEVNNFKEQKETIESDKRKIREKLKKMELISKANKSENQQMKNLQEDFNLMELTVKNKQKIIDDLNDDIINIKKQCEKSCKQFEIKITNQFNEKKRKYEETIDNLKKQIIELKTEKKRKSNQNELKTNISETVKKGIKSEDNGNDENQENISTTSHLSNDSNDSNNSNNSNISRKSNISNLSRRSTSSFVSYIGRDSKNNEIEIIDLENDSNEDENVEANDINEKKKEDENEDEDENKTKNKNKNKNKNTNKNRNKNKNKNKNENENESENEGENNDTNKVIEDKRNAFNNNSNNNNDNSSNSNNIEINKDKNSSNGDYKENNDNMKIDSNESNDDMKVDSFENNNKKIDEINNSDDNNDNNGNKINEKIETKKEIDNPPKSTKIKRKRRLKKAKSAIFLESMEAL